MIALAIEHVTASHHCVGEVEPIRTRDCHAGAVPPIGSGRHGRFEALLVAMSTSYALIDTQRRLVRQWAQSDGM